MKETPKIICCRCHVPLEPDRVNFKYLSYSFHKDQLLRCPICKQVFLPEALVRGQIAEVEMQLEDK